MENATKKTEGAVANTETKTATGKLKIQSPWIITYKKIVALFGRDADLEISSIVGLPDGNYGLSIFSKNTPKLQAIEKILKSEYTFGNVKLYIYHLSLKKIIRIQLLQLILKQLFQEIVYYQTCMKEKI